MRVRRIQLSERRGKNKLIRMEDPQNTPEPSQQQFENIDFNSSPEENNKADSSNDDQEQVNYIFHIVCCLLRRRNFRYQAMRRTIVFFIIMDKLFIQRLTLFWCSFCNIIRNVCR